MLWLVLWHLLLELPQELPLQPLQACLSHPLLLAAFCVLDLAASHSLQHQQCVPVVAGDAACGPAFTGNCDTLEVDVLQETKAKPVASTMFQGGQTTDCEHKQHRHLAHEVCRAIPRLADLATSICMSTVDIPKSLVTLQQAQLHNNGSCLVTVFCHAVWQRHAGLC